MNDLNNNLTAIGAQPVDIGIDGVQAYTLPDAQPTVHDLLSKIQDLTALVNTKENVINRLLNELDASANSKYLVQAIAKALTTNDDFIDDVASALADHKNFNMRGDIDYATLAEHIDCERIAERFDNGDIADWVSIDYDDLARAISYTDLACEIDYSDLADSVDYEDTIRDEVRERLSDLEIRNVTLTLGS